MLIEDIRTLPVEEIINGVMTPPLSLRSLSTACGLSPSTIRARVHAPGVMDDLRTRIEGGGQSVPALDNGEGERAP